MPDNTKKFVNFIFISTDWDIQHRKPLLNEFALKSNNWSDTVIVQQPVFLLGHFVTQFKRKILGLIMGRYRTQNLSNGAVLFTPVALFSYSLWLKYKLTAVIDSFLISKQVNKFHKKIYFDKLLILWVFYPCHHYLLGKINYNYLVYDFFDNFELHYDGSVLEVDSHYNELLIKKSDLTLCLAKQTYERAKSLSENAYYFQSGNNFEALSKDSSKNLTELDDVTMPIIGYLGAIRKWLDFNLLKNLIKNCSDICFVFIGFVNRDTKEEFNELLNYPNVRLINYVEQDRLSVYLKKFKAGIIPFQVNKFMESVFPNKFLEYMAAGLPVVTTALKELEDYSDLICYSKSEEEFIKNCKEAANGNLDYRKNDFIKLAKENSWSLKAENLSNVLFERVKGLTV